MESLKTIQKLSKLGKILSKIVYVFCLVGLILCIIGGLGLIFISESFELANIKIHGLIESNINFSKEIIYAALIIGIIELACEMYISKQAQKYFEYELEEGTPFTEEGANKIKRLGLIVIFIPLVASFVSALGFEIAKQTMNFTGKLDINFDISLTLGITFLILSAIFRYGSSLIKNKTENKE